MRGMAHVTAYAQAPIAPVETPPENPVEKPVYVRPLPAPRRPPNPPPTWNTMTPGPARGPAFDVSLTAQIGILALLALFLFMSLRS